MKSRDAGWAPETEALVQRARNAEPLGPGALDAIRERLREDRVVARPSLARRVALAAFLFLSGATVMAGATRVWKWVPLRAAATAPVRHAGVGHPRARVAAASPAPAPAVPELPEVAPAPRIEATPRRAARVAEAPPERAPGAATPAEAPAPNQPPAAFVAPPSELADEAALLARALRALRENADGAQALALLEAHDHRFGDRSPLAREAGLARIEALLRTGRHAQALARLEALSLPPSGRARELLATRAELRAEAGRCADALPDYDALLAGEPDTDGVTERALNGRAACRARRGDVAGARADLQAYAERFPEGKFAAAVRAALRP
jgi:hypothetical protein